MSKGDVWHVLAVQEPFDHNHALVSSPVFSSLTLAIVRLTIALYTLIVLIINLVWIAVKTPDNADPSVKVAGYVAVFCTF